ncbi:hypothetical protein ACFL07_00940 [Pseudomonadota bacterium]
MMIKETVFVEGQAVGQLLMETNTQAISFHPADDASRPPKRNWESIDELRQAVVEAYGIDEGPQVNEEHLEPQTDETQGAFDD